MRLGQLGLGQFGKGFAQLFASHPSVTEFAMCDMDGARLAEMAEHPAIAPKLNRDKCKTSYDEFVRLDLDAIVVITQPWLHAPQCLAALRAGKHVYSAVPVISLPDDDETLDWCHQLYHAVKETGLTYMLGETSLFHPEAMYCRQKQRENTFGDIYYMEGEYFHGFNHPQCDVRPIVAQRMNSPSASDWRERLAGYRERGQFNNPMVYPTHSLASPMSISGAKPRRVTCLGQKPFTQDPYWDETNQNFANMTALFQMDDDSVLRIAEHRDCSIVRETFRIYGIEASYENQTWCHKVRDHRYESLSDETMRDPLPETVLEAFVQAKEGADVYGGHRGSHPYLVHEFVSSIVDGRTPVGDITQSVSMMAAGVAARQSALNNGDWTDVVEVA